MKYSRSLKDYRDWHNTLNYAIEQETAKITRRISAKLRKEMREEVREEGREEGIAIGRAEGRAEGIAEGIAEGEKYTQIETAKRMMDANFSSELIAEFTGLSIDEIENLKTALQNKLG